MNNNLNFSKNVFGGQGETRIVGGNPMAMNNTDGGRMSVDEVRERQFNAETGTNPDNQAFQVEKQDAYTNPVNNASMTGAFTNNIPTPNSSANTQMDMTRTRVNAMKSINMNGPRGF